MTFFKTPIIHKVLIRASRETVYDAMTTAKGINGWFTSGTEIERKNGGVLTFKWVDWGPDKINDTVHCPILEVQVPERFVFQWWEDNPTTVEIDFDEVTEGTIVRLKESGYVDTPEGRKRYLDCATGWGEALTLLKFYVEYGIRY